MQLQDNPYLCRFVLVFDHEDYSPAFIGKMWQEHRIACITYHKFPGAGWGNGDDAICGDGHFSWHMFLNGGAGFFLVFQANILLRKRDLNSVFVKTPEYFHRYFGLQPTAFVYVLKPHAKLNVQTEITKSH